MKLGLLSANIPFRENKEGSDFENFKNRIRQIQKDKKDINGAPQRSLQNNKGLMSYDPVTGRRIYSNKKPLKTGILDSHEPIDTSDCVRQQSIEKEVKQVTKFLKHLTDVRNSVQTEYNEEETINKVSPAGAYTN